MIGGLKLRMFKNKSYLKKQYEESLRLIKTNIKNDLNNEKGNTILITSTDDKEGKTSIAKNLAIEFSKEHKKVILIECDFRNPCLKEEMLITIDKGLSNVLDKKIYLKDVINKYNDYLDVIISGKDANPENIIESNNIDKVINPLKEVYDYLIIDGTYLRTYADTQVLIPKVDGVVLVTKYDKTTIKNIKKCKKIIEDQKGKIIGAVLNMSKWGD